MPGFLTCFAAAPTFWRNALPAVALAIAAALAAPAHANDQQQTCIDTSDMVATIITLRAEGSRPNAIKRALKTGNNKVDAKYTDTVDPLVAWVFTIDKALVEQPTAPEAIAAEYRKTCVGYQP
ncbi:MAG: hypothetical protein NXH74_04645 [Rhodobacteraceae bacterium]|nr:hypothetical protein [Paracoccaceae bacterium]